MSRTACRSADRRRRSTRRRLPRHARADRCRRRRASALRPRAAECRPPRREACDEEHLFEQRRVRLDHVVVRADMRQLRRFADCAASSRNSRAASSCDGRRPARRSRARGSRRRSSRTSGRAVVRQDGAALRIAALRDRMHECGPAHRGAAASCPQASSAACARSARTAFVVRSISFDARSISAAGVDEHAQAHPASRSCSVKAWTWDWGRRVCVPRRSAFLASNT